MNSSYLRENAEFSWEIRIRQPQVIVAVAAATIRHTEKLIESCEKSNPEGAQHSAGKLENLLENKFSSGSHWKPPLRCIFDFCVENRDCR